jgi:hypothetical protein
MEFAVLVLAIGFIVQHLAHARERSILLDRIQAPERAPFTRHDSTPVDPDEAAEARRNLELVMAPDA